MLVAHAKKPFTESSPLPKRNVPTVELIKIAEKKSASGLPHSALHFVQEALSLEIRQWFCREYQKPIDSYRHSNAVQLLVKLRHIILIDRMAFKRLKDILDPQAALTMMEVDTAIEIVKRVAEFNVRAAAYEEAVGRVRALK